MREIKFRAWDGLNKKFTYWSMNDLCTWDTKDEKPSALDDWMQYTGLKDKNGLDIYEGDILKGVFDEHWVLRMGYNPHEFERGIIRWDYSGFMWELIEEDKRYVHDLVEVNDKEIVGNIYEHSELLNEVSRND